MSVDISQAHNEARLEGTRLFIDSGPGVGRVRVYDGTRPAPGGAPTTLLAEIPLDDPCGVVANNQLVLSSSTIALVAATGLATWARIVNGNGAWVLDSEVSDMSGSAAIKLSNVNLFEGGKVELASGVFG